MTSPDCEAARAAFEARAKDDIPDFSRHPVHTHAYADPDAEWAWRWWLAAWTAALSSRPADDVSWWCDEAHKHMKRANELEVSAIQMRTALRSIRANDTLRGKRGVCAEIADNALFGGLERPPGDGTDDDAERFRWMLENWADLADNGVLMGGSEEARARIDAARADEQIVDSQGLDADLDLPEGTIAARAAKEGE